MHPIRSGRRRLAIVATGVFALSLSAGSALAAPCLDCEEPELPGDPGGNPTCGITASVDPTITTATPRVGQAASGTQGTWAGSPTSFTFQWLAAGTSIPGANALTSPQLPASAENKSLVLRVTAHKSGCQSGVEYSAAKTVATGLAHTVAQEPALSTSSPKVGGPVAVTTGSWSPAAQSVTYQWRVDGAAVAGATTSSFTPPASALGKSLSVVVTAHTAGHHSGSTTRTTTNPVAQGSAPVATQAPSLSGTPKVGTAVSVNPGVWQPAAGHHTYRWQLDGIDVPGATASSYTPSASDAGKSLRVVVSAHTTGHAVGSATSDARNVTTTPVVALTAPTVTGKPVFGRTLTAAVGTYSGSPSSVKVQWQRNGVAIAGATSTSYRVGLADLGRNLSAVVTASKAGTPSVVQTVQAGKAVKAPARWTGPAVKLIGKAKVGRTLKPSLSSYRLRIGMAPDATKVSYQWFRSGKAIARAKSASYRLVKADRRKRMMVRIVLTRPGYQGIVLRSSTLLIRR